jgi:hypothetical protein
LACRISSPTANDSSAVAEIRARNASDRPIQPMISLKMAESPCADVPNSNGSAPAARRSRYSDSAVDRSNFE